MNKTKVEPTNTTNKDDADFSPATTAVLISGANVGVGLGVGTGSGGIIHLSPEKFQGKFLKCCALYSFIHIFVQNNYPNYVYCCW